MGTPIRLVKNNGETIDLMCTTLTMNVNRNMSPITLPFFGGSRLGFDLNLPSTVISMEGIVADDDKFSNAGAKKATSLIDFDNVKLGVEGYTLNEFNFSATDNIDNIIRTSTGVDVTPNDTSTASHAINLIHTVTGENGKIFLMKQPTNFTDATCDTDHSAGSGTTFGSNPKIVKCDSTALLSIGLTVSGTGIATNSVITQIDSSTLFRVDLDTTATNNNQTLTFSGYYGHQGFINARSWIAVHNSTTGADRTASEMAVDFAALVNLRTSVFNMTATVINSPTTGNSNTAVRIEQNTAGKSGNIKFPSFSKWPSNADKPYHLQFTGGKDNTSAGGHSAGDRVAEIYATLCNSNNGGIGIGNIVSGIASLGGNTDALLAGGDQKYGDYIIGLQIPFTSKINNNSSLFYMPTGAFKSVDDKTADMAEPVGTDFDNSGFGDSVYTGIKGAIADATFVQLGGEPLYSFTINFVPIDWII